MAQMNYQPDPVMSQQIASLTEKVNVLQQQKREYVNRDKTLTKKVGELEQNVQQLKA